MQKIDGNYLRKHIVAVLQSSKVAKTHFDRAQELGWESHQTKELQEVLQSIITAYDQVAVVSIGNINKKHDLQKRKLDRTYKREIERRIRESKRKKLENVISDIEKDLKAPSLSDGEALQLQQELKQLQAIQQRLNIARVGTLLAHQVRRINPEERRWNPHACSPDKIAPYGFNGTQRDRLS